MKNLKNIALTAAVLLLGAFTACKKGDGVNPDQSQLTNSAQIFLDDNSSIVQQGNDAVVATYVNNTLKVNFNQSGATIALEIPNYDLAAAQNTYANSSALLSLVKNSKTYNSSNIFIPVILQNPVRPIFVTDQLISITASNTKVDANTTDIGINIQSGSELITVPVSNGSAAIYDKIGFVQGAGGKPNMINIRIKK